MMGYADTSFLVSLYLADSHSAAAARVMDSKPTVFLTPLGELELTNALELGVFREEVEAWQAKLAQAAFRQDVASGIYPVKPMPPTVYEDATRMARTRSPRLGTRTLDILHVASALALGARAFYTFDERQRKLARAEGLHSPTL